MTMQPFKIQSPTLSLNGVNIDTSAQGKLVIPGVTRAGTSVAIEVEDTGDQTTAYTQLNGDPTLLTIIDGYQFAVLNGDVQGQVGWTAATYAADAIDGEGYIDGISVVTGGAGYTGEAVTYSQQMLATTYADPINNFNPGDWDWIPFRVRCGAGEIQSEFGGGGSGSGLVQRTVNFPQGEAGDTAGTLALAPDGNVYVCTADFTELQSQEFTFTTWVEYNISQSAHGQYESFGVDPAQDSGFAALASALSNGNYFFNSSEWVLASGFLDGDRTCVQFGRDTDGVHYSFVTLTLNGDPSTIPVDTEFTLIYTPTTGTAIWEQLSTGASSLGNLSVDGDVITSSNNYIETLTGAPPFSTYTSIDQGMKYGEIYTENDIAGPHNGYAWIETHLDEPNTPEVFIETQSSDTGVSKRWTFDGAGALTFPDGTKQTTAYTGQSGAGSSSLLYIFANADGTVITSSDGINWSAPVASGVPVAGWGNSPFPTAGVGKIDLHNGVIVYTRADMGTESFEPNTGLYYSTEIGVASLCVGTDAFMGDPLYWNEVHYFAETNMWVSVGWALGSYQYPVHAYSTDGIAWTVVPVAGVFLNSYNPSNNNWKLTDVAYNTTEGVYVFVGTVEAGYSGAFVTSDVTVTLGESNHVPVELNARYINNNPVTQWGGPPGYMMVVTDGYNGFWNTASPVADPASWYNDSDGPTTGWYQTGVSDAFGYIPTIAEVVSIAGYFVVTTADGQVVYTVPAPFLPAVVPLAYTSTDFTISAGSPATITVNSGGNAIQNEKIVISNANPSDYNGTYYVDALNGNALYTDKALSTGFDSTGLSAFISGTLTFSHGQFIDSVGVVGAVLFAGNDDEQVFRSLDFGATWTMVDDAMDYGAYFNDFAYGTFGTSSGAELVGDGYAAGTGYKYKIYSDIGGYQGGEESGAIVEGPSFNVGDTVTFRNGEVKTITTVNDWNVNQKWIIWDSPASYGDTSPQFPITITSTNYAPVTKSTARIKPDSTLANIGQYMDVYTGAAPVMDDAGHIHMKGHSGNVELFLGTDDNYVSSKEAGSTPASVKLKGENGVTVLDSDLRLYRNGSWASSYGDGWNRNIQNSTADISHNTIAADDLGNYYVGGEHHSNSDGYISKYSRNGNLLWSKYNDSNDINGWNIMAIATHDDEVGAIVRTNNSHNYNYAKLFVLDGATGDVKTIKDVYSDVGGLTAQSLIYHSTLGWTIAGVTSGDTLTSTAVGIGATGQNIIEVLAADAVITGLYPAYSSSWYVSGTGIDGLQQLNNDGVGLWQDKNTAAVTGSGVDARFNIRADYNYQGYSTVNSPTSTGSGYADRDIIIIQGSFLNGINNIPLSGLVDVLPEDGGDQYNLYFLKSNFPTLDTSVQVGDFVRDGVGAYFRVSDVVTTAPSDSNLWHVSIYPLNDTITATTGVVAFSRGNDWIACVSVVDGGVTGTYSMMGTAARTVVRLDMGWMGYSYDYSGQTFTFSYSAGDRPWVWTNSWDRFLEPPTTTNPTDYRGNGIAWNVAEDPITGGLVVVGYMYYPTVFYGNFMWKLASNGDTDWVMAMDGDDNDVFGVAVSPVTGAIYTTSRYSSINKFSNNGILLARKTTQSINIYEPYVFIERDLDGNEQVFFAGKGQSSYSGGNGLMVTKFDADLNPRWSREMYFDPRGLNTNYGYTQKHTVVRNGQASLVGYREIPYSSNNRGLIFTMSLDDNFKAYEQNDWIIRNVDGQYNDQSGLDVYNIVTDGVTSQASVTTYEIGNDLAWSKWQFQSLRYDLNTEDYGITGVSSIEFSDGGKLDHNPVDIPPNTAEIWDNWNYTLQLSDRGRFIMNQAEPNNSFVADLYITVPRNTDVPFPVGTVITLINSENANHHIYVRPYDWQSDADPKIYTPGFNNPGTWSFAGMQTATLMKISSNAWMLTATNVQDRS